MRRLLLASILFVGCQPLEKPEIVYRVEALEIQNDKLSGAVETLFDKSGEAVEVSRPTVESLRTTTENTETGEAITGAVSAVSPFLPPPFNVIIPGIAALFAGIFRKKR